MAQERLQKVMANAGVASRRACEEIIQAGRVTVNGQVVTELGVKVDPLLDQVRVDGDLLKPRPASRRTYLMLYKPAGVLSVFDDPRDRPGLENYVKEPVRLYPIGRLDMDSEGLLVLTDDGDLTLKLSHPRYEHPKTYLVLVDRVPGTDTLARFRRGILLDDGVTAPSTWRVLEHPAMVPPSSDPDAQTGVWLHVTLYEGRKRQVRRMAAAENMQVRRLVRVSIGSLRLDRKLQPGQSRPLTRRELDELQREADEQPDSVVPRRKPAGERSPEPAARRSSAGRAAASAPRPAVRSGNTAPVRSSRPDDERRPRRGPDDTPPRGPREERPPRSGRPGGFAGRPDDERRPRRRPDSAERGREPAAPSRARFNDRNEREDFADRPARRPRTGPGGQLPPRDRTDDRSPRSRFAQDDAPRRPRGQEREDRPRRFEGGNRPPRREDRPDRFERDGRPPVREEGMSEQRPRRAPRPAAPGRAGGSTRPPRGSAGNRPPRPGNSPNRRPSASASGAPRPKRKPRSA